MTRGERRVTEVRFGDVGQCMLAGMHRAIRAFALAGNDVVVDDLCLEPSILQDYLVALEGLWVLFVAVRAPLEVVQAREDARPGRFPGTAYSHFTMRCMPMAFTTLQSTRPPRARRTVPGGFRNLLIKGSNRWPLNVFGNTGVKAPGAQS